MLIYKILPHRYNKLEFKLISIASILIDFMKTERVFISRKGVFISYYGSRFLLESDQGSNGNPVSIQIPDVHSTISIDLEPGNKGRLIRQKEIIDSCILKFRYPNDRFIFAWNTIIALNELSSACRCAIGGNGLSQKDSSFVILGGLLDFNTAN